MKVKPNFSAKISIFSKEDQNWHIDARLDFYIGGNNPTYAEAEEFAKAILRDHVTDVDHTYIWTIKRV
jgi:hypothetical protein